MRHRSFAPALALALAAQGALAGEAPAGAGFDQLAGDWAGIVSEMGMARYQLRLTLSGDGSGEAVYPDFPCRTVLEPVAGPGLTLRETVAEGREHCADGTAELAVTDDRLRWTWRDAAGQVRAVGTLTRAE